jgi:hypothetical protein
MLFAAMKLDTAFSISWCFSCERAFSWASRAEKAASKKNRSKEMRLDV